MNYAFVERISNGMAQEFAFQFDYLDEAHISVTVNGTPAPFVFTSTHTIRTATVPPAGSTVSIRRSTPKDPLVDFEDASTLTEGDLDGANRQAIFLAQETLDQLAPLKTAVSALIDTVSPGDSVADHVFLAGDGTTASFYLGAGWEHYASADSLLVTWDRALIDPTYTIEDGWITFDVVPPNGSNICVRAGSLNFFSLVSEAETALTNATNAAEAASASLAAYAASAAADASDAHNYKLASAASVVAADAAKVDAQDARTGAQMAKADAQAALTDAQTARTDAQTARTDAQTSATNSAASAASANLHKAAAEASKAAALISEAAAASSAYNAATAQAAAETARDAANAFATAASLSATTADVAKDSAIAAQAAAAASAAAAETSRVQTASDRASVQASLATAQTLVGSAGTGTATGLVYAAQTKVLASVSDVVCVLVYDTRLDSDGGAWTIRPSGSWYWEALNTPTRGATRRFPTVALLVLRATSLTIYDAHDLDAEGVPRMWMLFGSNPTATQALYAGGGVSATSIAACNGRLWVSANTAGTGGLTEINFVADTSFVRRDTDTAFNVCRGLANRNTSLVSGGFTPRLVDDACTAVHAMVYHGGPLDSSGLAIPTVVVGTTVGASVIHPHGAVYDITRTGGFSGVRLITGGRLILSAAASDIVQVGPLPYADASDSAWRTGFYSPSNASASLRIAGAASNNLLITDGAIGNPSSSGGLTLLAEDTSNLAAGMVAYSTKDYATGWLHGDIRGAWLCDTKTGNVSGSTELVTNGDFTVDTSGWTASNSTLSVVSGSMRVTATSTSYPQARQSIITVPGKTYLLTFDVGTGSSGPVGILIGTTAGFAQLGVAFGTIGGRASYQFTATSSTTWLSTQHGSLTSGQTADYDNISVREAVPDRSYRARGLIVNGTLYRNALLCGIASFSGFSASNYLEQPYGTPIDLGYGDFSVSMWARSSVGSGYYLDRDSSTTGPRFSFVAYGSKLNFVVNDGTNGASVTSNSDIVGSIWHLWTAVRRGSTFELWCDGALEAVTTAVSVGSLTNTSARLRIGERVSTSAPATGMEASLVRISGNAPTPAQIRKMYDDERQLIINGLTATLGGTDNTVTAVTLNPASGAVSVGTIDGVSTYMGISRVNYHDGTATGGVMATDNAVSASASGPNLLIGTTGASGAVVFIGDAVVARDRMPPAGLPRVSASQDQQVVAARAVTTDATPTDMFPRIVIGEREALTVDVTVQARTYGSTSTQGGTYRRIARYIRDANGSITLAGSVQTIGTDQETTSGMDVTLQQDTTAQTVTPRVTGVAGARIVWTARIEITRISEDMAYAA